MDAKRLGTIGMAGVGSFVVALAFLHVLDPSVGVVDDYVSSYALGPHAWLSKVADLAMAVGVVAIAMGLRVALPDVKRRGIVWVLVTVAGLGFAGSAVFDTDPVGTVEPTTAGAIHDITGFVSILGLLIAAWMLVGVLRRSGWDEMVGAQRWFAVAMSAALVLLMMTEPIVGITQRVFVVVVSAWLLTVALQLRREIPARVAESAVSV